MLTVHVLLDRPAEAWQTACLRALESIPGPAICPGPVPATGASDRDLTAAGLSTVTVDLRADPAPGTWRVLSGAGRPLAEPDLFAETFGRPGRLSVILIVNGQNEIQRRAVLSSTGRSLERLRATARRLAAAMLRAAVSGHLEGRPPLAGLAGLRAIAPPAAPAPTGVARALLHLGGWGRHAATRLHQVTHTDVWHIGVLDAPIASLLDPAAPRPVRWLLLPAGTTYRADPFAHPLCPDEVWCERFDYGAPVGVLERLRLIGDRLEPVGDLPAPVHRSFPFMAEVDGTLIAVPEASASGQTTIYRLDRSGGGLAEVLSELAVPGIDPVVFRRDDRLWLALTRADLDNRSNLCLWHAPALTGPWTPHAGNPVKLDVRSARGAGTPFVHDGALFRPAQDGTRTYGGAVTINRLDDLTPRTFRETVVTVVRPAPDWPAPHGLHTVSAWGNRTLFDAKRETLSPAAVVARVRSRLSRVPPVESRDEPEHPSWVSQTDGLKIVDTVR